jgi:AAT family amino acid transporter
MPAGIFNMISGVSTINFVFVWLIMLWCHIKFRQAHPGGVKEFKMPGYPVTDYLSLIFFTAVLIFLLLDPEQRIPLAFSVIWFGALFVVYAIIHRKREA